MTLLFAPEAEDDFRQAIEYLRQRNPAAATKLGERIFAALDLLAAGEIEGPERQLTTGEQVRSWAVPPLRIYYQRHDDSLWVLRIYDQRQQPIERERD